MVCLEFALKFFLVGTKTRINKHGKMLKLTGTYIGSIGASQVVIVVKNPPGNAGRRKRCGFDPWVRKIPWRRAWRPTPVFLPGEPHRHWSLVGRSP